MKAFSLLANDHPNCWLVIAGVDQSHPYLRQAFADHVNGQSRRLLISRVGNVGDWYERADLFVLSSRFEGCPNVLMEAMASGTACLAIDCPTGPRELIQSGVNGELLPEKSDVKTLADTISNLIANSSMIERLGKLSSEGPRTVFPVCSTEAV